MADGWILNGSCGGCGTLPPPAARHCARCGQPLPVAGRAQPLEPDLSSLSGGAEPDAGEFPVVHSLATDERQPIWVGAGRHCFVLARAPTEGRIHVVTAGVANLAMKDSAHRFDPDVLSAVAATRAGLFVVEGGRLWGMARRKSAWVRLTNLLPADAKAVALTDDGERIHCLTTHNRRLTLFTGRGLTPLQPVATGPMDAADRPEDVWYTLVSDGVAGQAWGWGSHIRIDLRAGSLFVTEAAEAAPAPPSLFQRIGTAPHIGSLPKAGTFCAAAAITDGRWGVLDVNGGAPRPAPRDLDEATCATAVGRRGVMVFGPDAPALVRPGGSDREADVGRMAHWPSKCDSKALTGLEAGAVAVCTAAGKSFVSLLRIGHQGVVSEARRADLNPPARNGAALFAAGSLPPVALDGGLLVALHDGLEIAIWALPWGKLK